MVTANSSDFIVVSLVSCRWTMVHIKSYTRYVAIDTMDHSDGLLGTLFGPSGKFLAYLT